MTFYHYVEEMHNVDYRYHKKFTGDYTGVSGKAESKTYGLFVRDIKKDILTHVNPAGDMMWKKGIYSGYKPNEGYGLRVVLAVKMYDFVSDIIESGRAKNVLYRIEGEK